MGRASSDESWVARNVVLSEFSLSLFLSVSSWALLLLPQWSYPRKDLFPAAVSFAWAARNFRPCRCHLLVLQVPRPAPGLEANGPLEEEDDVPAVRGPLEVVDAHGGSGDETVAVAARKAPAYPRVALVKAAALLPQLGPAAHQQHHR